MATQKRTPAALVVLILCALLSACATPTAPTADPSMPDEVYDCLGTPVSAGVLTAEPPLDSLSDAGRDAVASATFEGIEPLELDENDGWFVGSEEEDTIVLLRTLDPSEAADVGMTPPDHEILTLSFVSHATNADPGWYVFGRSLCSIRVGLGSLAAADVQLDPEAPPNPASTQIALRVTERSCNSGEDAEGRIEVVDLVETETTVEFVVGIEPPAGAHTCQGNPPTPFTLDLASELGDRTLLDAGFVPARQLSSDQGS